MCLASRARREGSSDTWVGILNADKHVKHRLVNHVGLVGVKGSQVQIRSSRRSSRGRDRAVSRRSRRRPFARLLDEFNVELREGGYRPLPARRVFISKRGNGGAAAACIGSGPHRAGRSEDRARAGFEADFLPCSFGFRPRRSPHDALQLFIGEAWRGRRWVVETKPHAGCWSPMGSSCRMSPQSPVGAENAVTSCDLHILVYEAAEPVSSKRSDGRTGARRSAACGWLLMQ